jgi:peptidoglycan/xylan/chitin deacetylase (PgdA/CDA1 family)
MGGALREGPFKTWMFRAANGLRLPAIERLLEVLVVPKFPKDDDRNLLDWEELATLQRAGVEIGSHADRHDPLTERAIPDVRAALRKSREAPVSHFGPGRYGLAYPYGACGPAISAAAREAGFSCAAIGCPGVNGSKANRYALKRFLLGVDDDDLRMRALLSGLRTFGQSDRAWGSAS